MINRNLFREVLNIFILSIILLSVSFSGYSQIDTAYKRIDLNYKVYMNLVVNRNLEYMVEKFNVSIADARIGAARVFQNPSIEFTGGKDMADKSVKSFTVSTEVTKTFELGQKRKARIDLAKSGRAMANALLEEFVRNLLSNATIDYLNALKQNYLFNAMQNSYQMMKKLSDADSIRLMLGSIKSIDAIQSKIEAGILLNDLFQIDADRRNSFLTLSARTSTYHSDSLFYPAGKFEEFNREFDLGELLTEALNKRADLQAAKINITYNKDLYQLTRSERVADIDLKIGASDSYLNNKVFSPTAWDIYAGLAIPLKFSNFNKSELKIASYQIQQGELLYEQVEIKIRNEVIQAFNQYRSLCRQVENYDQGLLEQANKVLNGKVYSYSRGETSLLEVLNAQRTYNDLQISYYETLYNCYVALVELERSVGICDIDL